LTIGAFELQKNESILGSMPPVNDQIVRFLKFQRRNFEDLMRLQLAKLQAGKDTVDNDYRIKPEGHLVFFNCGHRG
jgi:hypothetical protein